MKRAYVIFNDNAIWPFTIDVETEMVIKENIENNGLPLIVKEVRFTDELFTDKTQVTA